MTSLNAGVWVGKRSTNAWLAAKLTASFLLASVRSTAARRNDPPRRVPTAWSSYAAQPSYIAVCTMARARAAIGGPGFATRIAWSAALSHRIATLSVVAATSWRTAAPPRSGYGDTASRAQLAAPRTTPATSQPVLRVILGMAPSLATRPPRRGPVGLARQARFARREVRAPIWLRVLLSDGDFNGS